MKPTRKFPLKKIFHVKTGIQIRKFIISIEEFWRQQSQLINYDKR